MSLRTNLQVFVLVLVLGLQVLVLSLSSSLKSLSVSLLNTIKLIYLMTQRVCVFAVQAEAVVDMIGFPEFILNATALDERYEQVCCVVCLFVWLS